jgi:hypothetical protein
MDPNAYSDEDQDEDTDQPDSYWRRRVITLAAGLSLLGVLAWAFSGGDGKPASLAPKTSQTTGMLPAAAVSGAPPLSTASPAAGPTVTGLPGKIIPGLPDASASRTASSTSGSSHAKKSTRTTSRGKSGTGAAPAVTSGSGREPNGDCLPSAVVLSLFTSKSEYYGGQDPEFGLYAVSTGAQSCSFATGPSKLHVVVMSAGRVIWDSADCSKGDARRAVELSRGVPAQESVTWNRSITLPGCVTLASAARVGTYRVQARTATVSSPVRTFKLARLPVRGLGRGPQDGGECLADVLHLHDLHEVRRAVSVL